jgi:hypothetical protein
LGGWQAACRRGESIIESMVIDMNEAQERTLARMRRVLAGTQVMEFQAAAGDEDCSAGIESSRPPGVPGLLARRASGTAATRAPSVRSEVAAQDRGLAAHAGVAVELTTVVKIPGDKTSRCRNAAAGSRAESNRHPSG